MRRLVVGLSLAFIAATAVSAAAQEVTEMSEAEMDRHVDLLQTNLAIQRADIVSESMELTAAESATFWPLYTEYEAQLQEIGGQRWQLIKDYSESFDDMSDEAAADLIERAFAIRDTRTSHQRDFIHRLMDAMGPRIAGRFMQVDNQLMNLFDLQIAQQLPLLKKPQ